MGILRVAAAERKHGVRKPIGPAPLGADADHDRVAAALDRQPVGRQRRINRCDGGGSLGRPWPVGRREWGGHGAGVEGGVTGRELIMATRAAIVPVLGGRSGFGRLFSAIVYSKELFTVRGASIA